MSAFENYLERMRQSPRALSALELSEMLATEDVGAWEAAYSCAREVKRLRGRDRILPRALIECSNLCAKDCLYCGIRKSNNNVTRYTLSEAVAAECCDEARRQGYDAIAFQSGELENDVNTVYYEHLLEKCRGLEVTLSLGEQTESVYSRWKTAGALRYLLRIETSNPTLYSKIHPQGYSFERRVRCIRTLKRLGYITGTGVMIGLPGQTINDLANDIVFFAEENVDMVGMGPYIPHPDTPLASSAEKIDLGRSLELSLRMISLARLHLWDVNIVAATALEAIDPQSGRERGIAAGANVIMNSITPPCQRAAYDLYPGKAVAR